MKVIVDINHPGHVHYFRNCIKILEKRGHSVLVVARSKPIILQLLEAYKIDYIERGEGKNSLLGKLFYMLLADIRLLKVALSFKPDICLSFTSPYLGHVAFLTRKPHIAVNDTEHVDRVNSILSYPFCTVIMTPHCYLNNIGPKQLRFKNVVEGFYINKKYCQYLGEEKDLFQTEIKDPFVFLRFVSWNAHHDVGHQGLDLDTKRKLIEMLKPRFKILISAEGDLDEEFKKYQIRIHPEHIHEVLSQATLFIGESATMASESAMLGTFAVYVNSLPLMGYLKLEEDAGLLKSFANSEGLLDFVDKISLTNKLKDNTRKKSEELRRDFINPTDYLAWILENYPQSLEEIRSDSKVQYRFKDIPVA